MLSVAGGCELSTTTSVKTSWKKFKELLPVLSSQHLSFKTRGRVYSSCMRSVMLHASETWTSTKPNLQSLQGNYRALIRQICNVSPQDTVTTRSNESYCWFSFALAFQLFRAVESSSLFHLCNLLIFCVLGDVALMS